ncbi:hypothetical protein WG947_02315 [Pontibacter sp. H259]|uniref:hypothetical protein n=1 Tax=Pontibacter sp. H259 TaxID=3133421 RepID=UPI0030BAA605
MKNLIRHIVLLVLALSIALGSVGIALGQQLCQMVMVGSTATPEKEMSGCCSESDSSDSEDDCCTLKVTYKKLDLVTTAKAEITKKAFEFTPFIVPQPLQFIPVKATAQTILTYSDSSPPLSGRDILLVKGTLQV